jgi:hypothetical protein
MSSESKSSDHDPDATHRSSTGAWPPIPVDDVIALSASTS